MRKWLAALLLIVPTATAAQDFGSGIPMVNVQPAASGATAPTVVEVSVANHTNGNPCAPAVSPTAATQTGDLLYAFCTYDSAGSLPTAVTTSPVTFTETSSQFSAFNSYSWAGYYEDDGTATYTFTANNTSAENCRCAIVTLRGHDSATPIGTESGPTTLGTTSSPSVDGSPSALTCDPSLQFYHLSTEQSISATPSGTTDHTTACSGGSGGNRSCESVVSTTGAWITSGTWTLGGSTEPIRYQVEVCGG